MDLEIREKHDGSVSLEESKHIRNFLECQLARVAEVAPTNSISEEPKNGRGRRERKGRSTREIEKQELEMFCSYKISELVIIFLDLKLGI